MKSILGLVSSARRLGNSEIMVKEVFRNLEDSCELSLLRLTDYRIESCRGCYTCLFNEGRCPIDDDHAAVLEALAAADALILAAPAYFLGAHSALKRFLDRGLTLYGNVDRLWNKPAVGVAIAGIPGMEGSTLLGVERFLKLILADVRQTRVVYGALPGEIFLNDDNRQAAGSLAASLFGPRVSKQAPCCPLCGGDTFRLLENHRVRCMLCSNTGTLISQGDALSLSMEKADHQLFLTRQDVLEHKTWLIGMKDRFVSQKKALKPIVMAYRKEGHWLKPATAQDGDSHEREKPS